MSFYRCLFCGHKGDDSNDFDEPTKKDIVKSAKVNECSYDEQLQEMENSDYEWLLCKYKSCIKYRKSL